MEVTQLLANFYHLSLLEEKVNANISVLGTETEWLLLMVSQSVLVHAREGLGSNVYLLTVK